MQRWIGVWCLLLFACDRGEKPAPQPETVSAGAVKSAAVAAPAASAVASISASPPAPSAAPQPAVTPTAGTLRLSIVADGELLKVDQSRLDLLAKVLEKGGKTVSATPVSDDERAYVKALAEKPGTSPALASSWGSFETVVLIRMEPPQTRGGAKLTGGRSHVVIVHPPARDPAFSAVYTEGASVGGASTDAAPLGNWLQAHLKLREKGKTP